MTSVNASQTNRLLGYPEDARLLLINADDFGMTLRLARCVYDQPFITRLQKQGSPTHDHRLMDSYDVDTVGKATPYAEMLRALPVGLSEWAVHPGLESTELQAVEPGQVRTTDFQFLMSPEARAIVTEEEIILVDYTQIRKLWNAISAR